MAIFQAGLGLGLSIWLAATVSFYLALAVNFLLWRYYAFAAVRRRKTMLGWQIFSYGVSALISLGLTQLILFVFAVRLGITPLLVKIAAVPVVFIWSVVAARFFIFKIKKEPPR